MESIQIKQLRWHYLQLWNIKSVHIIRAVSFQYSDNRWLSIQNTKLYLHRNVAMQLSLHIGKTWYWPESVYDSVDLTLHNSSGKIRPMETLRGFLVFPKLFILSSSMEVFKAKKHYSTSPTPDVHISILITIGSSQLLEVPVLLKRRVAMQHQIITAKKYSETI